MNIKRDPNPRPSGSKLDAVSTMPPHSDGLVRLVECTVIHPSSLTTIMTTKINSGYRIRKRGYKYTTLTIIFTKSLGNNNAVRL